MKSLISVISAMLVSVSAFCTDSLSVFYRIRLDGDIDAAAQRLVVLGLEKAEEADADYVMLDLDTYGGAVNAADSIRTAIETRLLIFILFKYHSVKPFFKFLAPLSLVYVIVSPTESVTA